MEALDDRASSAVHIALVLGPIGLSFRGIALDLALGTAADALRPVDSLPDPILDGGKRLAVSRWHRAEPEAAFALAGHGPSASRSTPGGLRLYPDQTACA